MRAKAVLRIRLITAAMLLLALLLVVRLYDLQIAKGEEFGKKAEEQYVHTVQNVFDRGNI